MSEDEIKTNSIHGFNIHLADEGSRTLKDLAHTWKHDMSRDDLDKVLHDARHAPEGKVHLDEHTTLIHNSHDNTYTIKKRS